MAHVLQLTGLQRERERRGHRRDDAHDREGKRDRLNELSVSMSMQLTVRQCRGAHRELALELRLVAELREQGVVCMAKLR